MIPVTDPDRLSRIPERRHECDKQNGTDSFSGLPLSSLSFAYEAQQDHAVYLAHVTPSSKKA